MVRKCEITVQPRIFAGITFRLDYGTGIAQISLVNVQWLINAGHNNPNDGRQAQRLLVALEVYGIAIETIAPRSSVPRFTFWPNTLPFDMW